MIKIKMPLELSFALKISRKAGKFLLSNFRRNLSERSSAVRGTAKEIKIVEDYKSERMIIKEITKHYPEHNILSEESGFIDKNSEYTWIVDPLDGSGNYVLGNPFFCISIALRKGQEIILGVVHAPFLGETYAAEKGKRAYCNGKKMKVSAINRMEKSYLLSCEGSERSNRNIARINSFLHPQAKDLRKLGSAALECSFVAMGRAEAYLVRKINPWDVAAGYLLVQEAGGKITTFDNQRWDGRTADLIFSNGKIHDKILKKLKRLN